MKLFVSNFKWIMLVAGLLTCTMLMGLMDPQYSLKSNFGVTLEGPVADIIVRNWSALIGLSGIMLIYGAFTPAVRRFVLVIASASKIVFILLVLTSGISYFGLGAGTAVIADAVMVVLFIVYLFFPQSGRLTNKA